MLKTITQLFYQTPPIYPPFPPKIMPYWVVGAVLGGDLCRVVSYFCYLGRCQVLKPLTRLFEPTPPIIPPFPPKITPDWVVGAVLGGDLCRVVSYFCYLGRYQVLKPLTQLFEPTPPIITPFPPKNGPKWVVGVVLGGDLWRESSYICYLGRY